MLNMEENYDDYDQHMYALSLQETFEIFYQSQQRKIFIFVVGMKGKKILLGAISREKNLLYDILPELYDEIEIKVVSQKIRETTLKAIVSLLITSDRNNFIVDVDDILEMFLLIELINRYRRNIRYREYILNGDRNKAELLEESKKMLCEETLYPEINRIFEGAVSDDIMGHPVHYIIQTEDANIRENIIEILLAALYKNNRIQSRRYCFINFEDRDNPPDQYFDYLYQSCEGGAIVVTYSSGDENYDSYTRVGVDVISRLCEVMLKYKNRVLTIFSFSKHCKKIKETFFGHLESTTIVEINEEMVFGDRAKNYLFQLAKNHGVHPDKNLYSYVLKKDVGYLAVDLNKEFDLWYGEKLKTTVYPQYNHIEVANNIVATAKPKGDAYLELKKMIGLSEAKKVIGQAIDYFKAQKLFKSKGMVQEYPAIHMVFTGTPGTAKTTVARLFASIMKDNGCLSKGDLYEVGRSDLVGKYVGWTAQIVREKFKVAKGSVLFIDEAYSLVDDKEGLYGDEAINTIVQEMENRREDMIVIFAGYPDQMAKFLKTNPGLPSRIAFHVSFCDYSSQELYDIAELIAGDKKLIFSKEVKEKLISMFNIARQNKDFGNGRFVRNLVESARMKQASRLLREDINSLTKEDISILLPEDFESPKLSFRQVKQRIGFIS